MGRAVSVGEGINWLTLVVLIVFHLGAVAALFFYTWQRLTVMVALATAMCWPSMWASACATTGC
jgi:hypothetical protein